MKEREHIDSFLFGELKAGNARSFDKIFNDHYQNLCRFANSFVHDEDTAQSLVQHVFVKLWENHTSLDHIEHLLPYLTSMVRNQCLNYISREKRNIKISDFPEETQIGNTTENQLNLNELEEDLIIALSTLPERCKIAFEYSRFENLTNKEIAQKMEISIKGVEALIGRSLKSLRISLADYLPSSKSTRFHDTILFSIFSKALTRKK
ncbi:MAG: RNA polymerase sigma-70 factor [Mariniphaga sp.]|nr:RNA polymerase sigma-70 factor [Mariniphaga sp.]